MMDDLRLAAVAARVVAWHNRHPLARRIAATHVHSVGYVGLPFVGEAGNTAPPILADMVSDGEIGMVDLTALEAAAGEEVALETGSLRERAQARARQQAAADAAPASAAAWPPPPASAARAAPAGDDGPVPPLSSLQPDFSEVFIDTLPPRRVAGFAARTGQVRARPPQDGPVRQVPANGAHPGSQPVRVYLLTAVIETGTRKSRIVLGTGLAAPVLGARVLDTPRLAAAVGLAALVVGGPTWWLRPAAAPQGLHPVAAVAGAASSAAPAAVTAAAASVASAAAAPSVATAAAAGDVAPQAGAPASTAAPAPQAPGVAPVLPLLSLISDEDKALARQARKALDAARAAAAASAAANTQVAAAATNTQVAAVAASDVPEPAPELPFKRRLRPATAASTAAEAPPPRPAAPAASPAPAATAMAFALSTRPLRTRAEAEQVQVAMRSLLRTLGGSAMQVDVLPQRDDWRVVALPFPSRTDAEKARALLVSRGMRVVVVEF